MSANKRIAWLDTSKGIGIFLVIIGHINIDPSIRGQIYAFHMPLFFILSGLLFSNRKPFKDFLLNKTRSLLIPYVAFSVIAVILVKLLIDQPSNHFVKTMIVSKRNNIDYDQPLWFLTALFIIEIIFYFISKYFKNKYFILVAVLVIGYYSSSQLGALAATNILPWSLDQALFYLFFFGLGYFLKQSGFLNKDLKRSLVLIVPSIIYVYFLFNVFIYDKVWAMVHLPLDLFFFKYCLWAVLAIAFVLYLSQYLSVLAAINFFGRNSIVLFALHTCLGFNLYNLYFAEKINPLFKNPTTLGIVITLFCLIVLTPVIFIVNKYIPFILGKKLKFK
jgi:acyltransferase